MPIARKETYLPTSCRQPLSPKRAHGTTNTIGEFKYLRFQYLPVYLEQLS